MSRFTLLIAAIPTLCAACEGPGPAEPAAAPPAASAQAQNDSTPPARDPASTAESADGGIMIGSGT